MRRTLALLAFLALLAPSKASAYLDHEAIHALYQEGSFEVVIRSLERYLQANPVHSRADSIFIAKHLAVVYAANPRTVDKGKFWMNRLLVLLPAASLLDMYVSEEIDRIFANVRKDFIERQKGFGVETRDLVLPDRPGQKPAKAAPQGEGKSAARPPRPEPAPEKTAHEARPRKEGKSWVKPTLFVAAALTGAVVGTYAYYTLHEDEAPPTKHVTVTRQPN